MKKKKSKKNNEEYLYLLAYGKNEPTCIGYTHDKETAKRFVKQRYHGEYVKVSMEDLKDVKLDDYKFVSDYHGYIMSEDEFTYWTEAWAQHRCDIMHYIHSLGEALFALKLSKKEYKEIEPLLQILSQYHHDYTHGIIDEYDEFDGYGESQYYNYHNIIKYFVENAL